MKILKKKYFFFLGGGGGWVRGRGGAEWWGQGGCVQRIEVFENLQKKIRGRGLVGRWGSGGGVGLVRGGGQGGCERNVG